MEDPRTEVGLAMRLHAYNGDLKIGSWNPHTHIAREETILTKNEITSEAYKSLFLERAKAFVRKSK